MNRYQLTDAYFVGCPASGSSVAKRSTQFEGRDLTAN